MGEMVENSRAFPESNSFADSASLVCGAIAAVLAVSAVVVYHLSGVGRDGLPVGYVQLAGVGVFVTALAAMALGGAQWMRRKTQSGGFSVSAHWGFWLGALSLLLWTANLALPPQFL